MNTDTALRAMVWKELRFNWRWAVMGAIGLLCDLVYQVSSGITNSDLEAIWAGIHSALSVGALLMALVLGVLQTAPEQSRDRWAFFLHRPVRPSHLLLGKAIVGIFLYLLTTVVPLLCVYAWLATPGRIAAPFDKLALVPGLTDILEGIPFYLASILCLVRKARWYGTKFLPLAAALSLPILVQVCPYFWEALALVFLFSLVLGFCLWDAFGVPEGRQRSITGRGAFGALIIVGFTFLQWSVVVLITGIPNVNWPLTDSREVYYQYSVLRSGNVVRQEIRNSRVTGGVGVGAAFSQRDLENFKDGSDPVQHLYVPNHRNSSKLIPFMAGTGQVTSLVRWSDSESKWFLCRGHLMVYSGEDKRLQGELTVAGFRSNVDLSRYGDFSLADTDTRRGLYSKATRFVIAKGTLYFFSGGRSIVQVFRPEQTAKLSGIGADEDGHLIAITKDTIYKISAAGQIELTLPRLFRPVEVGVVNHDHVLIKYDAYAGGHTPPLTASLLLEYSPSGRLLRSQSLPLLPEPNDTTRFPILSGPVGFVCPPLLNAAFHVFHGRYDSVFWTMPGVSAISGFSVADDLESNAFILGGLLASFVSALISFLVSRRAGLSRKQTVLWGLGALSIGIALVPAQVSAVESLLIQPEASAKKRFLARRPELDSVRRMLPEHRRVNKFGAIFRKEIQAVWRWAALGGMALIVGFFCEVYLNNGRLPDIQPVWSAVQTIMTIGGAVLGLGLSILQMYQEQSRDRWAFLVHRPATRGLLFIGKAAAGLLLYVIAASISMLVMTAWIASPGRFAFPFVWGLTYAGWMGLLCGVIFYFAGYLVMLRPVRWYGSRVLPALGAGMVTVIITNLPSLWISAVVCLVCVSIFGISAISQFRTPAGGRVVAGGLVPLGLVMVAGIVTVCIVVFGLSMALYNIVEPATVDKTPYSVYHIYDSGDIREDNYANGKMMSAITVKTGRAHLSEGQYAQTLDLGDLWFAGMNKPPSSSLGYSSPEAYVEELGGGSYGANLGWYRVNRRIVAFSTTDNTEQGLLTPGGYVSGPGQNLSSEAFDDWPTLYKGSVYFTILPKKDSLYFLDFSDKSVHPMMVGPMAAAAAAIAQISSSGFYEISVESAKRVIILSGDFLYIFSDTGYPLGKLSIKDYHRSYANGSIGVDAAGHLYLWLSNKFNSHDGDLIVETDSSARTVGTTRLPNLPRIDSQIPIGSPGLQFLTGCAISPLISSHFLAFVFHQPIGAVNADFVQVFGSNWKSVLAGQLLAVLICAALGWFIARRAGLAVLASLVWVGLCVAMLWVGVLLLISLYAWPARAACPSCGKKRFLEGSFCPHCRAGWSPPARTGTEIFEVVRREEVTLIS